MRFEYYPDTDSLYIELNPGRKRKPGARWRWWAGAVETSS
jgi:uncharacterized protein YuzE